MINNILFKKFIIITIPTLSLLIGFLFDEDLSTGGAKSDFLQIVPLISELANFKLENISNYTRHFPLHYLILSIPQFIFSDILITKLVYLFFSLLIPIFLYLNLSKLYPNNEINNLIISFAIIFIPFFRASAIWPNAHLTAIIFLIISNYFYLQFLEKRKKYFIFLNILFLSLSTYTMQSYVVFFLYFLYEYYKKNSFKNLIIILFFCFLLSIPGFYLILDTSVSNKLAFTKNIPYTILTNSSIIFFFTLFFLFNKKNLEIIIDNLKKIKLNEHIILFIFILFLYLNYENSTPNQGGGFFYIISFFIFNNDIIFNIISFLSIYIIYVFLKEDNKLFFIVLLNSLTSIGYSVSQKYFEPLLLILILGLRKNFLNKNTLTNKFEIYKVYLIIIIYFLIALVNNYLSVSNKI